MEKYDFNKNKIKLHNIVFAKTTNIDYDMTRYILLNGLEDLKYDEYILLEGSHCSCYDFDDTEWNAMKYTEEELIKLSQEMQKENKSWYEEEKKFYKDILEYFNEAI